MIHTVKSGETLAIIAANYRIPLKDLYKSNPGLAQLFPGQKLVIPSLVDPSTIPYEIRVSLSKRTLALFQNGRFFKIYPVGIGKMLTQTPYGEYVIVNREPLPGGPFGLMWLSLSRAGYGIHGTNNPSSIGKAVSHGCIRMYNRDVLELANIVPNGTRVIIE